MNETAPIDPSKRYADNPFMENQVITTKSKKISVFSTTGAHTKLVNEETGEAPETTVMAFREVDDAMFIKLFTQNIGLTFNLSSNGVKALNVLIWVLQQHISRDLILIDKYTHEDFMKSHDSQNIKLAYNTMAKGLSELCKAQIIAKSKRQGHYYINPHFVFNGDRVRFVTEIRRKKKSKSELLEQAGQTRLVAMESDTKNSDEESE